MVNWTRQQTALLIGLYEEETVLYDVKHRYYADQGMRNLSLERISEGMQGIRPNTTKKDITKKIKTLRSQYTYEKHKMERKKSGMDEDESVEPTLWCFQQLKFLDLDPGSRKPAKIEIKNPVEAFDPLDEEFTELSSAGSVSQHETPQKRKRYDEIHSEERISENDTFCRFIEKEMDSIRDIDILDDLKWQIQVAVRNAKEEYKKISKSNISIISENI